MSHFNKLFIRVNSGTGSRYGTEFGFNVTNFSQAVIVSKSKCEKIGAGGTASSESKTL